MAAPYATLVTMDVPSAPDTLRADALRFLRRFGLVAAAWSTLLAATAPSVDRPAVLWTGIAIIWIWAVASQAVDDARAWWLGWFAVAVGAELLGPLADTNGWSVVGGVSFIVLAGAALSGRRRVVVATVAVLAVVAIVRGVVAPGWNVGGGIGTILIFGFGGLALAWLVRAIQAGQRERDRLATEVVEAQQRQAVMAEREEAAARLHDSVLQTLTAIQRADTPAEQQRLAEQASSQLRSFIRRRPEVGTTSLRNHLDEVVTAAAAGRPVTVAAAGDAPLDERGRLLVEAAREAVCNAVEHTAGAVRVFLEATDDAIAVWVADDGDGFDLDSVPDDRLGIRNSIVGRMSRAGGTATLTSTEDGSEWELRLPPRPG